MKDYASMSDFEINRRVLEIMCGFKVLGYAHSADGRSAGYRSNSGDSHHWVDYCNNPAEAWPIITENRIGIIPAPDAGKWKSAHREVGKDDTPYHFTQSDNPLRAAMIVFLMMKEGEND